MICRAILIVLVLVYLFALGVFALGTYGWFGVEKDPLSGVFLIILGMPWVWLPFDAFLGQTWLPIVGVLAPIVNLAILRLICGRLAR